MENQIGIGDLVVLKGQPSRKMTVTTIEMIKEKKLVETTYYSRHNDAFKKATFDIKTLEKL